MEYRAFTSIETESSWYKSMCLLHDSIFTTQIADSIREELFLRAKFLILIAFDEERVVEFKIGYQNRKSRFHSWLGGLMDGAHIRNAML